MSSDFPAHWQLSPLEKVMEAIIDYRGKTPNKTSSGIPLITAKIVKDGRIQEPTEFIAEEDYDSWMTRGLPKVGDVVVTSEAPLGEVAQLTDSNIALAQRIVTLRGRKDILDNDYLLCAFQSTYVQNQLESRASGSTVKGIKQSELRKILLPIPPLNEQVEIAKQLKSLSDKIELNRQINQTLEQIAQAMFKSWFVDFEPTRAKIAAKEAGGDQAAIEQAAMCAISGKTPDQLNQSPPETLAQLKATAALFPDALVDSELGEIPEGWEVGGLKDCCIRVESGGTPSRNESSYWNGGIKWLSSGEVRDVIALNTKETISIEGLKNSSAKLWPVGTTVVAMYGATAGQVCMLANEMSANQACCALVPKAISRCYLFLTARLSVDELLSKASGSAQQNLNKSLVADHRILLPSDSILEVFESSVTSLIGSWIKNTEQNFVLAETRDSVLPKLLSGEIQLQIDVETINV